MYAMYDHNDHAHRVTLTHIDAHKHIPHACTHAHVHMHTHMHACTYTQAHTIDTTQHLYFCGNNVL